MKLPLGNPTKCLSLVHSSSFFYAACLFFCCTAAQFFFSPREWMQLSAIQPHLPCCCSVLNLFYILRGAFHGKGKSPLKISVMTSQLMYLILRDTFRCLAVGASTLIVHWPLGAVVLSPGPAAHQGRCSRTTVSPYQSATGRGRSCHSGTASTPRRRGRKSCSTTGVGGWMN